MHGERERRKKCDAKNGQSETCEKNIYTLLDCDKRRVIRINLLIFISYINFGCGFRVVCVCECDKRRPDRVRHLIYLLIYWLFFSAFRKTRHRVKRERACSQPLIFRQRVEVDNHIHSFKWCWCTHLEHFDRAFARGCLHLSRAHASLATKYATHDFYSSFVVRTLKNHSILQFSLNRRWTVYSLFFESFFSSILWTSFWFLHSMISFSSVRFFDARFVSFRDGSSYICYAFAYFSRSYSRSRCAWVCMMRASLVWQIERPTHHKSYLRRGFHVNFDIFFSLVRVRFAFILY